MKYCIPLCVLTPGTPHVSEWTITKNTKFPYIVLYPFQSLVIISYYLILTLYYHYYLKKRIITTNIYKDVSILVINNILDICHSSSYVLYTRMWLSFLIVTWLKACKPYFIYILIKYGHIYITIRLKWLVHTIYRELSI